MIPLARRQMGGAVASPPHDASGQKAGQSAVDRGVGLAENERQLRRIDEGRPAEGVEQLSFGDRHSTSVAIECPGGQPSRDGAHEAAELRLMPFHRESRLAHIACLAYAKLGAFTKS